MIETARANVIGYAALGTFLVAITVAQITTAIMKGSVDLTRRDMREAVMVADVMVALAVPVTAAAAIVAQALAKLDVEFGVRRTVVEEVVKVATRVVAFSVMGMGVAAVAGPAIRNLGVAAAAGVAAVATVGRLIEVGRRRIYEDYRAE
ncbi:MAG: hypothetical protein KGQ49_02920 [Verrucomicrobia bacterium]|nr:hypothetical protein [Verrucomicrobiota bacterium]MBU6446334.1 hypothetical protein [Verrucomicrobiota bacterium]MDE3047224.1 hypothetical protein [Verrucomicrobiota bacterium]